MRYSRRSALAGAAAVAAAGATPILAAETYTLRFGISLSQQSEIFTVATRFSQHVERKSGGRLKLEIYPNSSLAPQREVPAALQSGTIDITVQASTLFSSMVPALQVMDLPFLFRTVAAGEKVMDSSFGAEQFAALENQGIIGLSWAQDGFRQVETIGVQVRTPADMKGLRIRIQNSPLSVGMMRAIGGVPVTIDISETFISLQQHVIDGVELPLTTMIFEKFGNLTKYIAMTNHMLTVTLLLASKRKIEALPADLQKIIRDEGKVARAYWDPILTDAVEDATKQLRQKGVIFNEVDHGAFQRAMEPVYGQLDQKLGSSIVQRVQRIANG